MFKVGDKVVCINVKNKDDEKQKFKSSLDFHLEKLELNKIYTISHLTRYKDDTENRWITIDNNTFRYKTDRFILLSEFRKQKIEKILNKINGYTK